MGLLLLGCKMLRIFWDDAFQDRWFETKWSSVNLIWLFFQLLCMQY